MGLGTFQPVATERLEEHVMEEESYEVGREAAEAINRVAVEGRRIIAVGSTAARAIESAASSGGERKIAPIEGTTALYISPGYTFSIVDGLLTNFHLPCSTLLLLVCAFGGKDRIFDAYREAVDRRYRLYSYGDAMLIL
ncbi:MAG: S-adenosylmethionine:tRNA ribosyltransferase-isomerase [bacterium]|nr:S-adenosylmethionine:tRNA ribosyltransferase-isomerase [bacterium]